MSPYNSAQVQLFADEELGNPIYTLNAIIAHFAGDTQCQPVFSQLKRGTELVPRIVAISSELRVHSVSDRIIINSAPLQSCRYHQCACLVSLRYGD